MGSHLLRRHKRTAVAAGATTALMLAPALVALPAAADDPDSVADSAAHAHGIHIDGLGLDVIGAARADSEFPSDIGPNGDDLDVSVLNAIDVNLGTATLPLITSTPGGEGLLYLGDLGAAHSQAQSQGLRHSQAAFGLLSDEGALNLDPDGGVGTDPAELNLASLLSQVLGEEVAEEILTDASIKLGLLGSQVTKDAGTVSDEYVVAGLELDVESPLVAELIDSADDIVNEGIGPILDVVGPGGEIERLLSSVIDTIDALPGTSAQLDTLSVDTSSLVDSVRDVLTGTVSNTEGSVVVDLSQGLIHVDLAEFIIDQHGTQNLSSLPANTDVLTPEVINGIVAGVSEALIGNGPDSLVTHLADVIEDGIYDIELNIKIEVKVQLLGTVPLLTAPVYVNGTLGGVLGQPGHDDVVIDVSGINVAGISIDDVLQPLTDALTGLVSDIGSELDGVIPDLVQGLQPALVDVVSPLVESLVGESSAVKQLLDNVVQLTINEQPSEGDLGPESTTVRALSAEVLPILGDDSVNLELGSSTVKALDEVDDVEITDPNDGEEFQLQESDNGEIAIPVAGTGQADADITVNVDGQTHDTVVDANGEWSILTDPLTEGDYQATAEQDAGNDDLSHDTVTFSILPFQDDGNGDDDDPGDDDTGDDDKGDDPGDDDTGDDDDDGDGKGDGDDDGQAPADDDKAGGDGKGDGDDDGQAPADDDKAGGDGADDLPRTGSNATTGVLIAALLLITGAAGTFIARNQRKMG